MGFIALIPRLEAAEYNRPLMAYYSSSTQPMGMLGPAETPGESGGGEAGNPVAATPGRFDSIESGGHPAGMRGDED